MGLGWGLGWLSSPQQLGSRGKGKTLVPLLLGDGSCRWWWPELVLEVDSRIHLVESDPAAFAGGLGVLTTPISPAAEASQYAVEHDLLYYYYYPRNIASCTSAAC